MSLFSIFIKNRFTSHIASMHFIQARIVLSRIEINISIHKTSLSQRNYLFKSANINFSIYFYIVNIITNVSKIRNEINKVIKIFEKFRLNKLIEFEHFNVMYIYSRNVNVAIRRLKLKHKNSFFQKYLNFRWKK